MLESIRNEKTEDLIKEIERIPPNHHEAIFKLMKAYETHLSSKPHSHTTV
jgi:hypothetical protein